MRGTGCFFLYDKKNFNGLKRKVDWAMQPLLEEITMRSIKFLPKDYADGSEDCPKSWVWPKISNLYYKLNSELMVGRKGRSAQTANSQVYWRH